MIAPMPLLGKIPGGKTLAVTDGGVGGHALFHAFFRCRVKARRVTGIYLLEALTKPRQQQMARFWESLFAEAFGFLRSRMIGALSPLALSVQAVWLFPFALPLEGG